MIATALRGKACAASRPAPQPARPSPTPRPALNIVMRADPGQASRDNRSNQLNPNNPNYQGGSTKYPGSGDKADLDNHSQQLNPNNPQHKDNQGGSGSGQKK